MDFFSRYATPPKNLFKTLFFTFLFGYIPIMVLQIILNLMHKVPVKVNGELQYGTPAVIMIILLSPLMVLIITCLVWLYFKCGNVLLNVTKRIFNK